MSKAKKTDYDLLQFCIVESTNDPHERENLHQEMDEYFSYGKKYEDLSGDAKNVLSRYEFIKTGQASNTEDTEEQLYREGR